MDKSVLMYSFSAMDTGNNVIGASFTFPATSFGNELYLTELSITSLVIDSLTGNQFYTPSMATFNKQGTPQEGLTMVLDNLVPIGSGSTNSIYLACNTEEKWSGRIQLMANSVYEFLAVVGQVAPVITNEYWCYFSIKLEGAFFR